MTTTLHYRKHIKYPFGKLNEGEHFDIIEAPLNSVAAAAVQYAKRHAGFKFSTSTLLSPDGRQVVRVWRVRKGA